MRTEYTECSSWGVASRISHPFQTSSANETNGVVGRETVLGKKKGRKEKERKKVPPSEFTKDVLGRALKLTAVTAESLG